MFKVPRSVFGVPTWVWLVGLAGAAAVMGPALGPGSLLNLDLVLVPNPPVPGGAWGLGPELPRRMPMWLAIAWLSSIFGGGLVGKATMLAGIVVAFAGMFRLVARSIEAGRAVAVGAPADLVTAAAAATLYAFGPFLVTRLAVGHLMIVWTMALLPWAAEDLMNPDRSARRTLLWSSAIGFTGVYGGIIAGILVVSGTIHRHGRRFWTVVGVYVIAQLPWLVPMSIVAITGPAGGQIADAGDFPSDVAGLKGMGALLAGHGFWNPPFQIGWPAGWPVAVAGFALLMLGVVGTKDLPAQWRLTLLLLGSIGVLVSASSGVPGLDSLVVRITRTPVGAPFRETQRILPLYLLWVSPASCLGCRRLAMSLSRDRTRGSTRVLLPALCAAPLVVALLLDAPGLWGAGGQLRPVDYPSEWALARDSVQNEPGTMVAFPWYQYFTFSVAQNRLVLNSAPLYFGGDVLVSSDFGILDTSGSSPSTRERGSRRESSVDLLVYELKQGHSISQNLSHLGVRWILLVKNVDWTLYEPGLTSDRGLDVAVSGPTLALYRVKAWSGPVTTDSGSIVDSSNIIAPLQSVAASGTARAAIPTQGGWLRGTSPVGSTEDGLLALPAGSGPLWYWPAAVVAMGDLIWLAAILRALRRRPKLVKN